MRKPPLIWTRRNFINATAAGLSALPSSALLSSCGDSTTSPSDEVDSSTPSGPLRAHILGPDWAHLKVGRGVRLLFDSKGSSGPIAQRLWSATAPDGAETPQPYSGTQFSHVFDQLGVHVVKLRVQDDSGAYSETELSTEIRPAVDPPGYDVPLLFLSYPGSGVTPTVYRANVDPFGHREEIITALYWGGLSWSPDGTRFAASGYAASGRVSKPNIFLVDAVTGTETLLDETPGITWMPAWSRSGEWIAFTDDSRIPTPEDELVIIRPDGSERRPLSGDQLDEAFYAWSPTWSPDDSRLAAGNCIFDVDGAEVRRVAIYENIFTGPEKKRLHGEDVLEAFIGAHREDLGTPQMISEGFNGVAWSPSGDWLAYSMNYADVSTTYAGVSGYHLLVLADASGAGPVKLLDVSPSDESHALLAMTWSPDENYVYYGKRVEGVSKIFRVQAGGGPPEPVSGRIGSLSGESNTSPTLYG